MATPRTSLDVSAYWPYVAKLLGWPTRYSPLDLLIDDLLARPIHHFALLDRTQRKHR